ncbi:MAG: FAD-binding protein [Thaumarchaeota archaeon]|nr:FAD-binding protein [Nitrososphaerota archaeon]
MATRLLQTDILVVGSGLAGCIAAMHAHDLGVEVLVLEKGLFAKSGSSVMASRFSLYTFDPKPLSDWGGGPYVQPGLIDDEDLRRNLKVETASNAQASWRFLAEFENMGALFRRSSDGNIWPQTAGGCHSSKLDMTGKMVMQVLGAQVKKRGVKILESTVATRLLTRNGEVVGATALDIERGELLAIAAKSVILATGSTAWYPTSTLPDNLSGDGSAMAFRAGAEIADLCEIIFYNYKNPAVPPRRWVFPIEDWDMKPLDWRTPKTLNARGDDIWQMPEYRRWFTAAAAHGLDGKKQGIPLWLKVYVNACEIAAGRGTEHGGVCVSYRHMADLAGKMKESWWRYSFFEKIGVNPTLDLMEVGVVPHLERGGVVTDAKTEATGLPGLFVIGSAISGVGGLMGCVSTAKWSAKYGVERCQRLEKTPVPDESDIAADENRISRLLETAGKGEGFFPSSVKRMVKQVLQDTCFFWKDEKTMRQGLERLADIRSYVLPNLRLESGSRRFNQGLVDALDAENLLDLSELYVEMALRKKESRGVFRRLDYPEESNVFTGVRVRLVDGEKRFRTVTVKIPWE